MEGERIPRPGEIYNHFKDKPYQIITVATHSETGERMVVYQALYGDFKTYVRPLNMFVSEVDREKYPDAKQNYRFELRMNEDTKEIQEKETVKAQNKDPKQEKREKLFNEINDSEKLKQTKSVMGTKEASEASVKEKNLRPDTEREVKTEQRLTKINSDLKSQAITSERKPSEISDDRKLPEAITASKIPEESVNSILLEFLDANSYSKKLNVITGNVKHLNDRLINDMAVSLDCSVEEGPLENRIQGLIICLKAMCRFEDRRLR